MFGKGGGSAEFLFCGSAESAEEESKRPNSSLVLAGLHELGMGVSNWWRFLGACDGLDNILDAPTVHPTSCALFSHSFSTF
ncbi:unnamed protein product [Effrenium voratum]|nr:unnamed protein product [Effrenium voratum]